MCIAAPEIKYPCRYGIDTPTKEELISTKFTPEEIATSMGADSLGFLSIEGLKESLGNDREYVLMVSTSLVEIQRLLVVIELAKERLI